MHEMKDLRSNNGRSPLHFQPQQLSQKFCWDPVRLRAGLLSDFENENCSCHFTLSQYLKKMLIIDKSEANMPKKVYLSLKERLVKVRQEKKINED